MADNKNYYYLKIKENFYDSEEMIIFASPEVISLLPILKDTLFIYFPWCILRHLFR